MIMGLGALIGIDIFSKSLTLVSILQFFIAAFLVNAMLVGALYGIIWSIFMIFRNLKKFIKEFKKSIKNKKTVLVKRIVFVLFMLLILSAIFIPDKYIKLMLFYLAVVLILTFYLWITIKAVENACMLKYVKPQKLTEGDWIAKDVKVNGKYITGPKDLGIEKKNIKKLIEFYKRGKIKKILIKEGIPFVPSFFVAYIITLIYGNLVFLII